MNVLTLLSSASLTLLLVGCNGSNETSDTLENEQSSVTQNNIETNAQTSETILSLSSLSDIAKKSETKDDFVKNSLQSLTPAITRSFRSQTVSQEEIDQVLQNQDDIVYELETNILVTSSLSSYYALAEQTSTQIDTQENSLMQTLFDKVTAYITSLIEKLFFPTTSNGTTNDTNNDTNEVELSNDTQETVVTVTETTSPTPQEPVQEETQVSESTNDETTVISEVEAPVQHYCNAIEIVTDYLNVRSTPNTNNEKIATIEAGEQYVVVGEEGNWLNIWFDEETRWVYGSNYTKNLDLPCAKVVNTNSLNVRSGPSTSYDVLGTVVGDSLWVYIDYEVNQESSWKNIWFKGQKSWSHGNYLEDVTNEDSTSEPIITIIVDNFTINENDTTTESEFVTIFAQTNVDVVSYQLSENENFNDATWSDYSKIINFTLSSQSGNKTLYFRVKDVNGRLSQTVSSTIELLASIEDSNALRSINRDTFYASYRTQFGPLNTTQITGLNYLLDNFERDTEAAYKNLSVWNNQISYLLATTKHEVANTYTPITEYSDTHCVNYDGGCTYKGRGYVQLTHKYNYEAMSPITGVDLVTEPEKALEPDIAYTVMSYGSFHGIFTSRKLGDYIKEDLTDYYNARRVINGVDKASLIKGYAEKFETILSASAK